MSDLVLSAKHISKTYKLPSGSIKVLNDFSIDIKQGEHVAIVGKSGSGKSTALHILGTLDKPDKSPETSINFASVGELTKLSENRKALLRAEKIGFVFQTYHLMPEMNIVDNVALPNMALKKRNPQAKERAIALLEAVGLGERLAHKPLELSGGEQQRVAVARALINSPELILADEPTGNLDPATGDSILDILFSLSSKLPLIGGEQKAPPALLIVTHTPHIAEKCDRILTLEKGVLN